MSPLSLPGITVPISRLALGTMLYGSRIPREDAFVLLDAFAAGGGTVLDTANGYAGWLPDGAGRSETTIGEWLRETGMREQVVVATKGGQPRRPDLTNRANPVELSRDLAESLDRLGLPSVDLYWFHRDNPEAPVDELMTWAWAQIDAGRFHAIGASNWTHDRITAANRLAGAEGRPPLVGSQIGWSLLETRTGGIGDKSLVHMNPEQYTGYAESKIPVFAYQAQARGFFSPEKRQSETHLQRYDTPLNRRRLVQIDALAAQRGLTQNQVALAWFWSQPFPCVPVIGARTLGQLRDSLGAMTVVLDRAEQELLTNPST